MRRLKNITITVDEQVGRWARIYAARNETSVSRLVGDLLRQRMQEEQGYEAAMRQYLARRPVVLKESGGYPRREQLHDRHGLR